MPFTRDNQPSPASKSPMRKRGRPKGRKNQRSIDMALALSEHGLTPLEYLLLIMRDPDESVDRRMQAATSAAPYMHAKMPQAMSHQFPNGIPPLVIRREA